MGSPVLSIAQLIKNSWRLTFDKKEMESRIIPFVVVFFFYGDFWLASFIFFDSIFPEICKTFGLPAELLTIILSSILLTVIFILIFSVIPIGVLYSFHVPQKSSYDQIFAEGFKRLFPFLLVFLLSLSLG